MTSKTGTAIRIVAFFVGTLTLSSFLLHISLKYMISQLPNDRSFEFPQSISFIELKKSLSTLEYLLQECQIVFLLTFSGVYLLKQTFAIPGSVLLNLLAGFLLPLYVAFPLTCLLCSMGSSLCYMLSYGIGSEKYLIRLTTWAKPGKLEEMRREVNSSFKNGKLFYFLLFLRLFPFSPNWFVNLSSPWLNVPFKYFYCSVLFGLMPYNYITVKAGRVVATLESAQDIFDWKTTLSLTFLAILALLPAILNDRAKEYIRKTTQ